MSFILDALRKAEAEQQQRGARRPALPLVAPARRRHVWILPAAVLLANALVLAYLWQRPPAPAGPIGSDPETPALTHTEASVETETESGVGLGDEDGAAALTLDIHVFSEQPEQRFVLINGRRYQQGDRLVEGPLLDSITRNGAVLVDRQRRFELNIEP